MSFCITKIGRFGDTKDTYYYSRKLQKNPSVLRQRDFSFYFKLPAISVKITPSACAPASGYPKLLSPTVPARPMRATISFVYSAPLTAASAPFSKAVLRLLRLRRYLTKSLHMEQVRQQVFYHQLPLLYRMIFHR